MEACGEPPCRMPSAGRDRIFVRKGAIRGSGEVIAGPLYGEGRTVAQRSSPRPGRQPKAGAFRIVPLTTERWDDLVSLFGPRGACGGCWCMWWRIPRREFERRKGAGNRRAMRRIVSSGEVPGLIAYHGGEPVAWCSVAPRERFPVLERSRVLRRVDELPVWSIVCFFIARPWRRRGLSGALIDAAVRYAERKGANAVEAYPVDPRRAAMPDAFAWTGLASSFRKAGFVEVARRSPGRPVMRRYLRGGGRTGKPSAPGAARARGESAKRSCS
jgi:GNAT superfamily N-acetyltransferase